MLAQIKRYTVEEFEQIAELPENQDRLFEFIGGEIVEVPSNPYVSEIAALIIFYLRLFLREKGVDGHVTGEAGGYRVMGERYAPDVAYMDSTRQANLPYDQGYNPNPPDLAVEVVSPSDNDRRRSIKIANYIAAGVVIWVVYPQTFEVEIYRPGKAVQILDINDTIDGGDVLPGLSLPVKDIFPPKKET